MVTSYLKKIDFGPLASVLFVPNMLERLAESAHIMLYLFPSDQEEVYSCQVYAELLAEAHQQVPDAHAGPQGY